MKPSKPQKEKNETKIFTGSVRMKSGQGIAFTSRDK